MDKCSFRIHSVELQTYRHLEIADTTFWLDTRKSESHKHASQHWHQIISGCALARNTLLHMTILSNLIGRTAIAVHAGVQVHGARDTHFSFPADK